MEVKKKHLDGKERKYRNPKTEERKHMGTGPHAYFPPKFL
jgi:hypothetical protein